MRLSAFRAKNEVAEFVFGDALLVIGGVILGSDGAGPWRITIGAAGVVGGLFLGMRVLGSFSAGLAEARDQIKGAVSSLHAADRAAKETGRLLSRQQSDVETLTRKMREAERKLDSTKNDMKRQADEARKAFERIFGHSSSFSRFNWADTLEQRVQDHEKRLTGMERDAERLRHDRGHLR